MTSIPTCGPLKAKIHTAAVSCLIGMKSSHLATIAVTVIVLSLGLITLSGSLR